MPGGSGVDLGPLLPFAMVLARNSTALKAAGDGAGSYARSNDERGSALAGRECQSGCGERTKGSKFCRGSDLKLRKAIDDMVGGLERPRAIVEAPLGKVISAGSSAP